jgi:hypothetical protein
MSERIPLSHSKQAGITRCIITIAIKQVDVLILFKDDLIPTLLTIPKIQRLKVFFKEVPLNVAPPAECCEKASLLAEECYIEEGVSVYPGDGSNRWPAVHRLDAAHLFCLALEKAPAGSVLHAVADEGVPVREIAGVISRRLGVSVVALPAEEVGNQSGFIGNHIFSRDIPASSTQTQQRLGWHPVQPGLLADLEGDYYFTNEAWSKFVEERA